MEHPARLSTSDGILRPPKRIPDHMLVIARWCGSAADSKPLRRPWIAHHSPSRSAAGPGRRGCAHRPAVAPRRRKARHRISSLVAASNPWSTAPTPSRLTSTTAPQSKADLLLVSVGRRSQTRGIGLEDAGVAINHRDHVEVDEYLRTANPKIWAAGDCIGGLQLAHLGSAEGGRAARKRNSARSHADDRTVVPSCIYTHPKLPWLASTPKPPRQPESR